MLELNSSCLNMVCKDIVEALPLLCEVVALKHLQAAYLMEANDTPLIKCDEQLTTGA